MKLLITPMLVLLAACASSGARSSATPVDDSVHAAVMRIIASDNARDLDAAIDCYAPDAEWMPPLENPVVGHAALRARYSSMFAAFRPEITCTIDETWSLGEDAVVRGRTGGRLVAIEDGSVRKIDDKFLMILHREQDGAWRIQRLMWNANRHD